MQTIKLPQLLVFFCLIFSIPYASANETTPQDSYLRDVLIQEIKIAENAKIDLYVMSQCPFGVKAEKFIIPILQELEGQVDFNLRFIVNETKDGGFSSLHGQPEVEENRRQLIVSRHFKAQFYDYLLERAKDYYSDDWQSPAKLAGIDIEKLAVLMASEEELTVFRTNITFSNIKKIFGSPSLFINGKKYRGGFTVRKKRIRKVAADGTCVMGANDGATCCVDADCESICRGGINDGTTGCSDDPSCSECIHGDPALLGSPCGADTDCGNACENGLNAGDACMNDMQCTNVCTGGFNDGLENCGDDDACNACIGGGGEGNPCIEDSDCLVGCQGGQNDGMPCTGEADCPNICEGGFDDGMVGCINDLDCSNECVGGTNPGQACFSDFDCPGGGNCPNVATCNTGSCTDMGTCEQGTCDIGTCTDAGACDMGTCEHGTCDVGMPVELVTFNVILDNSNKVNLYWKTAAERNNKGFEIQHSLDGVDWKIIDFVTGHGTTTETQTYNWSDKNPIPGINYYRLKQIDHDGKFSILRTKAVELIGNDLVVQLFPNPMRGNANLYLYSQKEEKITVKVYNSLGQMVLKSKHRMSVGDNIFPINLDGFLPGHYNLVVKRKWKVLTKRQLVLK